MQCNIQTAELVCEIMFPIPWSHVCVHDNPSENACVNFLYIHTQFHNGLLASALPIL